MPTIAQQPIDIQWEVALASAITPLTWYGALAAALALSAANGNAAVQFCQVLETVTAGSVSTQYTLPNVQLDQLSPQVNYIVQLASAGTSYPRATAETAAYTLSAANANAPVVIARVQFTLTAP